MYASGDNPKVMLDRDALPPCNRPTCKGTLKDSEVVTGMTGFCASQIVARSLHRDLIVLLQEVCRVHRLTWVILRRSWLGDEYITLPGF